MFPILRFCSHYLIDLVIVSRIRHENEATFVASVTDSEYDMFSTILTGMPPVYVYFPNTTLQPSLLRCEGPFEPSSCIEVLPL